MGIGVSVLRLTVGAVLAFAANCTANSIDSVGFILDSRRCPWLGHDHAGLRPA